MSNTSAPYVINQNLCTFCGGCASVCPADAIIIEDNSSQISLSCIDCGSCAAFCPISAIQENKGAICTTMS